MDPAIQQLQKQIDDLRQQMNNLYRSSSIDRNVETALIERLGLSNIASVVIGTGTEVSTTQNIGLTGNPQTITVPAQPSGALDVTYNGITYALLYK